jgi:hypothetical protein
LKAFGQPIRDLRADDADEDDRQPVDPGNIAAPAKLQDQCGEQETDHDRCCHACSQTDMHGEIVGAGFADGGRQDLDDPEDCRDFRDLVEQQGKRRIHGCGHDGSPRENGGGSKAMRHHGDADLGAA